MEVVPRVTAQISDATRRPLLRFRFEFVHANRAESLRSVHARVKVAARHIRNLLNLSVNFLAFPADPLVHAIGHEGECEPAQQRVHHVARVKNEVEVGDVELAVLIQLQNLEHCK